MAYEDLVPESDVLIGFTLNNNINHFGTLTPSSVTQNATGEFVQDHPFDSSKYSLKRTWTGATNTFTQHLMYFIEPSTNGNATVTGGGRNAIEFWFKYTNATNGTVPAINDMVTLGVYDNTYGEIATPKASLSGGGTYGSSTNGTFLFAHRSSTTTQTRYSTNLISPNTWHHVVMQYQSDKASRNRIYLYIDGFYENNESTNVTPLTESATGLKSISFGGSATNATGATFNIAEIRYFNRALTRAEILNRGQFGKGRPRNLVSTMLSDNPEVLIKMDESSAPFSMQGNNTAAWGSELRTTYDAGYGWFYGNTGVQINQIGNRGKGWKWQCANTSNGYLDGSFKTRLGELWSDISKSVTIEWFSTAPIYDSAVSSNPASRVLGIGSTTGDGRITFNLAGETNSATQTTSPGTCIPTAIEYWSGTAFITGSLSDLGGVLTSPGNVTKPGTITSQNNYAQWADGQFHHHVLLYDRTTTNRLRVYYFFDGVLYRWRDFGANSAQPTFNFTDSVVKFNFGHFSGTTTNRYVTMDNLAIYNGLLSENQIKNHYYAFVNEDLAIKYYDGTSWQTSSAQKVWNGSAWIDWSKKYYDGSQWVTI